MKNELNENKGITLIALVVTIIVLLILAGVTIATLTGDNGLLQKATTAKEENEKAKELELIKLAVAAAQIAGEGSITTYNLNNELKSIFLNNDEVELRNDNWYYREYTISKEGEVYITLNLNQNVLNIERYNKFKLIVTESNIPNNEIIWSSSDETIATVSDDGIVTGMQKGNAVITARYKNNKSIKNTCEVNVTPVYIVKDGNLINTNYIIPDLDENSKLEQKDGYVEYYAYTPSQYKTGIGWKFEGEKEFEKLTMVWNAPERSDSAAWGAQLFIGKDQPIYELGREHYPNASYGAYELFKNGSNVINNITTTSFNLRPQNDSEHWYIDLQTYFRAANGIHWRKFNIYDLYLE